jgi:hypothetical protein
VVTNVLLLNTPNNPLTSMLISRALAQNGSNGILDAIICLSASQYQCTISTAGVSGDKAEASGVEKLKWKRHGRAIKRHIHMLSQLSKQSSKPSDSLTIDPQELLILTMMLYQFSLCEGGSSAGRQVHFNAARELIRQIYQDGCYDPADHDQFDSFVLNWFYFHDICSSLTSRKDGPCIDLHRRCLYGGASGGATTAPATALASRYQLLADQQSQTEVFLIGPSDGLLTIIARIIRLHREHPPQDEEDQNFDIEVFMEGLAIEADLREWRHDYMDAESANVAECYRLAGFILLWFTMYPNSPLDSEKVQHAVRQGLQLMEQLPADDNAQTCSLLPLFVFGVSTDSQEERALIKAKIEHYGSWASIANIIEAGQVLEQWWRAADKLNQNLRRWWDWEMYLKANELDIILV